MVFLDMARWCPSKLEEAMRKDSIFLSFTGNLVYNNAGGHDRWRASSVCVNRNARVSFCVFAFSEKVFLMLAIMLNCTRSTFAVACDLSHGASLCDTIDLATLLY